MTPAALLRQMASRFHQAGIPDPETDSSLLLSFLCGTPPLFLRLDTETELDESILRSYQRLAARRMTREPLQYIIGEVAFCGLSIHVDPRVLIPRPETALLCEWALEKLKSFSAPNVLDLCCGSGCIGLVIASERPDSSVTLSDCSPDALAVAGENAARLHLSVAFDQSDLAADLPQRSFDMILSNPPYIPTGACRTLQPEVKKEPAIALDGGADGLDFYRRIVLKSHVLLKPGGLLLMELGEGEAAAVSHLMESAGFSLIEIRKDLNRIDRMIYGCNAVPEEVCSIS